MKKQDLKNAFATIINGKLYVLPKDLIEFIEEDIETVMLVDVSGEFLEQGCKWHVTRSGGKATKIKKIMPLYTVDTFKLLQSYGLGHNYYNQANSFLLNHLIQYEKPLPWDLLDYVLEDGLKNNQSYDVNAMLSLVRNKENAKWLLAKGAKCCHIFGYGHTEINLLTSALVRDDFSVFDLIVERDALDYEWLTSCNESNVMTVDNLRLHFRNKAQADYRLEQVYKKEQIIAAKNKWRNNQL